MRFYFLGGAERKTNMRKSLWFVINMKLNAAGDENRRKIKRRNTHRLFTLSTETVAALKAGDLQLVSIIDKTVRALRGRNRRKQSSPTYLIKYPLFNRQQTIRSCVTSNVLIY